MILHDFYIMQIMFFCLRSGQNEQSPKKYLVVHLFLCSEVKRFIGESEIPVACTRAAEGPLLTEGWAERGRGSWVTVLPSHSLAVLAATHVSQRRTGSQRTCLVWPSARR